MFGSGLLLMGMLLFAGSGAVGSANLAGTLVFDTSAEAHVLNVPYRSQLDGSPYALASCGPTSLAMALAYHGVDSSARELRVRAMKAQHSWVDDDGGYSDDYGVFVYNLATVAEDLGMHANGLWVRDGARLDHLHEWQASELRRELRVDQPVIVQVAYRLLPSHMGSSVLDDHFIVLHGMVASDFVYSDPLGFGNGGPDEEISERDLLAAMDGASTPRVGFAVVKPGGCCVSSIVDADVDTANVRGRRRPAAG